MGTCLLGAGFRRLFFYSLGGKPFSPNALLSSQASVFSQAKAKISAAQGQLMCHLGGLKANMVRSG